MPKVAKPLPILTEEQNALVETYWHEDPHSLLARVWPQKEGLTLRHMEWKAIRARLATLGKKPMAVLDQKSATLVAGLSEEHKEYIRVNYKDASGPLELAKTLFRNDVLLPNAHEVTMVTAYIRTLDAKYRREDEPVDEEEYQSPKTIKDLVNRMNRYGVNTNVDGKTLFEDGRFTSQETKQLESLLGYMRRPVFKVEADKFQKKLDREVFESVFIANCWEKSDLSPEHILQYIQLASCTVQRNQADRMVRKLDERFNASLEDPSKRLSKPEVDALNATRDKATEAVKQINALIKTLTGERAKIISERVAGSASMHPLVQAWKTKEGREKQLVLAKKYNQELKAEVGRLAGMDALRAEIWGLDPDTIAY